MRILAIGLGGAGGRLADTLLRMDRAGRVRCVEASAIDTDAAALRQLQAIPEEHRLYYPPVGPEAIDLEQVLFHLRRQDASGVDALLLCLGAGGETAALAPAIAETLGRRSGAGDARRPAAALGGADRAAASCARAGGGTRSSFRQRDLRRWRTPTRDPSPVPTRP